MEMLDPITTVEALLEHPKVRKSAVLQIDLFDAVHFRLFKPEPVFGLIEKRLCLRDPEKFRGYAAERKAVEGTMRSEPLEARIATCSTRNPRWTGERQVLYSMELEVWMEISYPSPWALNLYTQALMQDRRLHIPNESTFPDLFIRLLLQKNGFERLAEDPDPAMMTRVSVSLPSAEASESLTFSPEIPDQRPHALADGPSLGALLANGVMVSEREEQVAREPDPRKRYLDDIGYRLIGPMLTLLFQELAKREGPIGFCGKGSGFLTTMGQELRTPWPWLPEIVNPEKGKFAVSIFPDPRGDLSLLPPPGGEKPSIISREQFEPLHLLLPPVESFITAAVKGSKAPHIQSRASAFLRDFAQVSRGLSLPFEVEDILRQWRQQILSPKREFVETLSRRGVLPHFARTQLPWTTYRMVKRGPWPTGSYLSSCCLNRWWVNLNAPERSGDIRHWQNELQQAAT